MKHLDQRNSNADIFVVPQEEGGAEDDNYFGSIGDATMRHVQGLSHGERQLWEELIHMGSGAIFRPVPSLDQFDKDPFNLKGQDLEEVIKEYKALGISDESLTAFKEAVDVETERRESSEDALDRGELITYNEWEDNPQMWQGRDIPAAPKDKMAFMGSSTQSFYDHFPEGHQNADFINRVLHTLDRDWCGDKDDTGYANWVIQNVIVPAEAKEYVKRYLEQLVTQLASGEYDSEDVIEEHLQKIDNEWGYRHRTLAKKKWLESNEMVRILRLNGKQWQARFDNGEPVYKDIKEFGGNIFRDHELRGKMSGSAWAMYKRIKRRFLPPIQFKGKDLNRCSVQDLRNILSISDKEARAIWFERDGKQPFESLHAMRYRGYIRGNAFANNEEAAKLVEGMEKRAAECIEEKKLTKLIGVRQKLNAMQTANNPQLSSDQWKLLWDYYRLLKNDVLRAVHGDQEKGETNV